jgi:hypothetical protein
MPPRSFSCVYRAGCIGHGLTDEFTCKNGEDGFLMTKECGIKGTRTLAILDEATSGKYSRPNVRPECASEKAVINDARLWGGNWSP